MWKCPCRSFVNNSYDYTPATTCAITTLFRRIRTEKSRLEAEDKLWIATAAADGSSHLVPFSFVWDGVRVSLATARDNPAAHNVARTGKARLALGSISDIVLIDGTVSVIALQALDDILAERLSRVSAINARQAPGYVYPQLPPVRIQAWWSAAERAHPTIMREGRWLAL